MEVATTEMRVARVSVLRARAMTQLEEADTADVFKWFVQHVIESTREGILQVGTGKSITGAQIKRAMSQSGEENRKALYELFEYRVSAREIRALEAQLQAFRGFHAEEHTRTTRGKKAKTSNETSFCCPWTEKAWSEHCGDCRRRGERQWGGKLQLMEQLCQQMNDVVKAATVASKEQEFFNSQGRWNEQCS